MYLNQELARVWPDAKRITLGDHQVFFYENPTPAHKYHSVVVVLDFHHAVELTARDSYDFALAEQLLDQTKRLSEEHFAKSCLTVFDHQCARPYSFTCVVFVPPSIAQRFETQSNLLSANTGWLFPAYHGEFVDGESSTEFWHTIRRKDDRQIHVVRWDRQPGWTRVQSYTAPGK